MESSSFSSISSICFTNFGKAWFVLVDRYGKLLKIISVLPTNVYLPLFFRITQQKFFFFSVSDIFGFLIQILTASTFIIPFILICWPPDIGAHILSESSLNVLWNGLLEKKSDSLTGFWLLAYLATLPTKSAYSSSLETTDSFIWTNTLLISSLFL